MDLPSSASALGDNESQIEHNFGEYEGGLSIRVLFESLQTFSKTEPWSAKGVPTFHAGGVEFVANLKQIREDECVTLFSKSEFYMPARAAKLLKAACDLDFLQPDLPAEVAGLDVVKRLRDNVQKLQKFERVDLLDQGTMKRICLILSSCMGDLGPIAHGSFIQYPLMVEVNARLFLIANQLLADGSQRHNLDIDIREFISRWINRYFPVQGGWEKHDQTSRRRFKNARTNVYKHTHPATVLDIEYFCLTEVVDKGLLRFTNPNETSTESEAPSDVAGSQRKINSATTITRTLSELRSKVP